MFDEADRRIMSFGERPKDFNVLQRSVTLSLIARGYIKLSGPDSRKFLQGQVTCDMQLVVDGQVIRGAHCTPKGRILFLFTAHCDTNDNIILETHQSITAQAIANLKKYAVFFKTEITDMSAALVTFLVAGPNCSDVLQGLSTQPLPQPGAHLQEADFWLYCLANERYSITYTSPEVHAILKEGFEDSPMFSGRIKGLGPRYCPSIEDKIERFSTKDRHQLFIEPEGRDTVEIYLNGFSTSLPEDVQLKALRKIKGLEKVKMFRAGYAIEYDYFPPTQLKHTL